MRLLIVVLLVALSSTLAMGAPCTGDGPECVLRCIEEAYANRDLDSFRDLFADDYEFFFADNPDSWGREEEVKAHVKMFDPDSVPSLKLTILEGFTVHDAADPYTWVIEGVTAQLEMSLLRGGKVHHLTPTALDSCVLHVRRVDKPESHYQIYRWWTAAK